MPKQDIETDASATSIMLSTAALMLSGLALVAYFMFQAVSKPQAAKTAPNVTTADACQDSFESQEVLFNRLVELKTQLGEQWSQSCQDRLDNVLYQTALDKAIEGQFRSSFTRLCQIPARTESEYFREAQFLFSLWENNRNTSGKNQEIRPLLANFFETYDSPRKNCPAAIGILAKLSLEDTQGLP